MIGLVSTALSLALASALSPVTISGNAFYNGSDTRFYIRGVDYQPGGSSNASDPLADVDSCKRDVKYFSELGLNTVRVYTVDNTADHDECMQALADAGIYLLLDVNSPKQSLNRLNNETLKASYNSGYLQHIFATIDSFKDYSNTLGFFAANEVINSDNTTEAAPYIKAVVRDMKAYIKAQANRTIPVGYSAADISQNRWEQMCYLNCGSNDTERIDMFGFNDYSWCGSASSFQISGWAQNVQDYKNYSIPVFLSEYGCNKVTPRTFPEVSSLYSTDMSSVYSGGLVYEYSNEANNYGLVDISGDSVSPRPDFSNLKSALSKAPSPTGAAGATTSRQPEQCPPFEEGKWEVEPDAPVPPMPSYAQRYLKNGAGKGLGLNGPDTQAGSNLDNPNASSSSSSDSSSTSTSSSPSSSSSSSSSPASSTSSSASSTSASSASTSASTASSASAAGAAAAGSASSASSGSSSTSSGKKKNGGLVTGPNMGLGSALLALAALI